MIAAMGGLDLIVFTGGIGENDGQVRDRIAQGLMWAGFCGVVILPAEEEKQIALEAWALMSS